MTLPSQTRRQVDFWLGTTGMSLLVFVPGFASRLLPDRRFAPWTILLVLVPLLVLAPIRPVAALGALWPLAVGFATTVITAPFLTTTCYMEAATQRDIDAAGLGTFATPQVTVCAAALTALASAVFRERTARPQMANRVAIGVGAAILVATLALAVQITARASHSFSNRAMVVSLVETPVIVLASYLFHRRLTRFTAPPSDSGSKGTGDAFT